MTPFFRNTALIAMLICAGAGLCASQQRPETYWVCVSNERSGDVTILDGATSKLVVTIPVGKRGEVFMPARTATIFTWRWAARRWRPAQTRRQGQPDLRAK